MYRLLFRVLLRRLPAEDAHRAGFALIRAAGRVPGLPWLLRRLLAPTDPVLRVRALGRDLPGPLGLAAGFDKDALGLDALGALGFSFVEVGTVTAEPQPGNPGPRLSRLPRDRALVNRLGFNNRGAAAAAVRLRARSGGTAGGVMVGANIGKTRTVPESGAASDYAASARLLADAADYVVVNVSSPNTPGLRDLQAPERLRPVLAAVRDALDTSAGAASAGHVPLLVKIAPDLADDDIDAIADLAVEVGLDGIIATNTTVLRDHLDSDPAEIEAAGPGGLSGPPLQQRALQVLRRLRARAGDRLTLVAAGGIENSGDAWQRVQAGATLLQAYTGFVYGGPLWPHNVQAGLARRVREAGFASLQQAVGTERRSTGGEPPRTRTPLLRPDAPASSVGQARIRLANRESRGGQRRLTVAGSGGDAAGTESLARSVRCRRRTCSRLTAGRRLKSSSTCRGRSQGPVSCWSRSARPGLIPLTGSAGPASARPGRQRRSSR
jgi:dihydroorotate dehydrogenase